MEKEGATGAAGAAKSVAEKAAGAAGAANNVAEKAAGEAAQPGLRPLGRKKKISAPASPFAEAIKARDAALQHAEEERKKREAEAARRKAELETKAKAREESKKVFSHRTRRGQPLLDRSVEHYLSKILKEGK